MQLTIDSPQQFPVIPQTMRTVAVGYWRVLVAIALSLVVLGGTIAMTNMPAVQQAFSCASNESMLVYPLYDRRGNITDTRSICGAAHRGCTRRSEGSQVFDCSPFMAPEELWAGGGIMFN